MAARRCSAHCSLLLRYCSDDCGRRLARHRLYQILPSRIQEWNSTPTIANEQGKVELERIRVRMEQARNELNALGKSLDFNFCVRFFFFGRIVQSLVLGEL